MSCRASHEGAIRCIRNIGRISTRDRLLGRLAQPTSPVHRASKAKCVPGVSVSNAVPGWGGRARGCADPEVVELVRVECRAKGWDRSALLDHCSGD